MLQSITAFKDYFASIRRRTLSYARAVPADQLDWAPEPGEYTCGDIIRHIGAAESMYIHLISAGVWRYPGHVRAADATLADLIAALDASHAAAMTALQHIPDTELNHLRPSFVPDGPPIKVWRWLMALVEHEIHHRSQLASYLKLMGCEPPQIFGVTVEDLIARATE